jgi:hypothetical protein
MMVSIHLNLFKIHLTIHICSNVDILDINYPSAVQNALSETQVATFTQNYT